MASSGSFLTNGWYSDSKGDYVYLEFGWSVSSTSIENNSKTIYWELRGKREKSGYVTCGGFKVIIDGDTVYSKPTSHRIDVYNGTVIASGYKTITHNTDGTRSFAVYIEGAIYWNAVYHTGSKTYTLDTIPRASSISCTSANIESNPTITINRASSNFTHTIDYKFGSLSGSIVYKTSATSITGWVIPADFYAQIPNAKTGEGTLTCTTYNGSTQIGDPQTCKLLVTTDEAKCKPTVSGTVVDDNPATIALTGNNNILVRYCSNAKCTINATTNKGAGSISLKTINNYVISGTESTFNNVETSVFDFYAKDSREYHNSHKVAKTSSTFIQYIKLTNDATGQRTDPTSGNATLTLEGNYFSGSFGASSNTITVKYRQGTSGDYTTVTPNISGNRYSATVSLTELDYTKAFSYEVVVSDRLSTVTKTVTIQKGIPVFDWGEYDFNFNVPVTINGRNIMGPLGDYLGLDLNDIKTKSGYYISGSSPTEAVGCKNFPTDHTGMLTVVGNGGFAYQIYMTYSGLIYTRSYYEVSGWTAWKQIQMS